jgi:serine/threonine-protein kinase HipA
MMEKPVLVYVNLQGTSVLVGRLWARTRKGRDSATFEYDDGWLARPDRFSLEPALKLLRVDGADHAANRT